jgi:uncharacterized membrane protein (DUF2068 family)
VVAKTGKKVEMARGLSKLHVLPLRAHDPGELMEYWARNSSPALTHALAKHIWGPIFYSAIAVMCAISLWAIWKDKSWARRWAVAASAIFFLEFVRQFIIPVRPAWDHNLSALIAAVTGMAAFSWPDKRTDAPSSH